MRYRFFMIPVHAADDSAGVGFGMVADGWPDTNDVAPTGGSARDDKEVVSRVLRGIFGAG